MKESVMKANKLFCLLVFSVLIATCGNNDAKNSLAYRQDGARLEIEERVDMGEVGEPEYKKFVNIPFKNTGTDTLKIFAAVPECDCTEVEVITPEVAPGESGLMRAYLDLKDYPEIQVEKPFFIKSNNADEQYVYVTLVAVKK